MNVGFFKKTVCFALALVLTAGLLPVPEAHAAESDLETVVEQQIRAFADSIDKKNADDDAAWALASHGISGRGKKLSVGKTHALTATLMNSELTQTVLAEGCAAAIHLMQGLGLSELPYIHGPYRWEGKSRTGALSVYLTADISNENKGAYLLNYKEPYSGSLNGYDDSLRWIVGAADINLSIKRSKVTAENVVYQVTCMVEDRFDFDTANGKFFDDLMSFIGMLLFNEFDWTSTMSFELTVPYACSHSPQAYHWSYNAENGTFTTDGTGGFAPNEVTRHIYTKSNGETACYYELEQAVRLYHDRPWVMEYDVLNQGNLFFTPFKSMNGEALAPSLRGSMGTQLFVLERDCLEQGSQWDYYGLANLHKRFTYVRKDKTYTFRLENNVDNDGNMIFLSIYETNTGKLCLDRTPMDDHYRQEAELVLQSEENRWVSGKDLFIRYIGNTTHDFSADQFELRVWENGEGAEAESLCTKKVTKPTCTAKGYTTYTCTACGYSWKADSVKAKGHSYKTAVTAPACTEGGYTTYTCSACKDSYTADAVPALGHTYSAGLCTACGDDTVTATLEGTSFTLSGEFAEGTRVLAACYDGEGRFTGTEVFCWQGGELTGTLPEAAEIRLFFADAAHAPLREGLRLK